MKIRVKKCKGQNKAFGFDGCGELFVVRKYGLCQNCLKEWVRTTDEGAEYATSFALNVQKVNNLERNKTERERTHKMRINAYSNKYKKELGDRVNELSRIIDKHFGYSQCIDCELGYGEQMDASHFHNKGQYPALTWNLHNLHGANSHCNQYHGGKKEGYYKGLVFRYGQEYADFVKFEMPLKYKVTKLSEVEIFEKLTLVRKLIRDFSTFQLNDSVQARNLFNKIIAIYI